MKDMKNVKLAKDKVEDNNKNSFASSIIWASIYLVLVLALCFSCVLVFRNFYYESIFVSGSSMSPTLSGNVNEPLGADYGTIDRHENAKKNLRRYQIVTTYYPGSTQSYKIKRVLVLPGETFKILDNNLYLYNKTSLTWGEALPMPFDRTLPSIPKSYNLGLPKTLNNDEYFLAGDNWSNSTDSFVIGPINYSYLVGVVTKIEGRCTVVNGKVTEKEPYQTRYFTGVDY